MIEINKIYCENCLDTMARMADNSIDMIMTDPPYGLNYNNGDLAHNWERAFGGNIENMEGRPIDNDGEKEAMQLFRSMLKEARRILKPGACCCCCCCGGGPKPLFAKWTLWMDKYLKFKQAVVWDKGGLGMGIHYRRNYEFVLVAQKPGATCIWNGGKTTPNIVRFSKIIPSAEQHPTKKPINLFRHFIRLHSNEGDLIYDPFAGDGTTGVAAVIEKRNFILSEIKQEYVDRGNRDILNEQNQIKLKFVA